MNKYYMILVGCGIAHTTNIRLDRVFVKLGFGGGGFPGSFDDFSPECRAAIGTQQLTI